MHLIFVICFSVDIVTVLPGKVIELVVHTDYPEPCHILYKVVLLSELLSVLPDIIQKDFPVVHHLPVDIHLDILRIIGGNPWGDHNLPFTLRPVIIHECAAKLLGKFILGLHRARCKGIPAKRISGGKVVSVLKSPIATPISSFDNLLAIAIS